jgi:hypothetical protein
MKVLRHNTIKILLAFMALCFAPLGHAQCGPFEIQVGQQDFGGVIAPVCAPAGEPDVYEAEPRYLPDYYMAYALHVDTTSIWVSKGYASSEQAENAVREACATAMGEGCVAHWGSNDSYFVFTQDDVGVVYSGWDVEEANAAATALQGCREIGGDTDRHCRVVKTVHNEKIVGGLIGLIAGRDRDDFPASPQRRIFTASASPPDESEARWLAVGFRSGGYQEAIEAAVAACSRATAMECEARFWTGSEAGNPLVARYLTNDATMSYSNVASVAAARAIEQQNSAAGWRLIDTFDASTQQVLAINGDVSLAPVRGFAALARPEDSAAANAWGKRALVTGKASAAEADAAATALCETDSRLPCRSVLSDAGVYPFVLLYRDGQSASGAAFIYSYSVEYARQEQEKSCREQQQQCSQGLVIGLAVPVAVVLTEF